MVKPIIHFIFALTIASYFLLISEALPRGWPEIGEGMCRCPGDRDPDCHCLPPAEDYQVRTTTTPAISPPIELTKRCNRNSDCNGIVTTFLRCKKTFVYTVNNSLKKGKTGDKVTCSIASFTLPNTQERCSATVSLLL
uniref:Uncharacterized protein n=1 Tax=Brassica oleracea TaxID=3712 RepID=A0A3P6F320_BRAOL|nr:unnamed protein product [Brassica oleracea]